MKRSTMTKRGGALLSLLLLSLATTAWSASFNRDDLNRFKKDGVCEKCNLAGAPNLFKGNFPEARLAGANLSWISFKGTKLQGADLSGANLTGADLREVELINANLTGANLYGARLDWGDFQWADLSGVNLNGAMLSNANMRGANLKGAKVKGADFWKVILSGATWSDGRVCAEGSVGVCK